MNSREKFEAWITSPPYERSADREGEYGTWPGQYLSYETQLSWESWQEAVRQTRDECANICASIGSVWGAQANGEMIANAIRAKGDST